MTMMQVSMLCALDSFLAAAGMGAAGCPTRYRVRLAFGFAACDAAAALAGMWLRLEVPALGVMAALAMGLALLLAAARAPRLFLLLPLLLSVDNLAAGAAAGSGGVAGLAAMSAAASGIAAWTGFTAGRRALHTLPRPAALMGAAAALAIALLR
jgi:hypothetical protein